MTFVLDTNSLRVLTNYYPTRFPTFWSQIDGLVAAGKLLSVREVRRELDDFHKPEEHIHQWVTKHKHIFVTPTEDEGKFVSEIFKVPHFSALVNEKRRLRGGPVADPFVIAAAEYRSGCVVTEERFKENASKIPNVCRHFGVECCTFEGMLDHLGWSF